MSSLPLLSFIFGLRQSLCSRPSWGTWTASPFVSYAMFSYAMTQFHYSSSRASSGVDPEGEAELVDFDALPGYARLRELLSS